MSRWPGWRAQARGQTCMSGNLTMTLEAKEMSVKLLRNNTGEAGGDLALGVTPENL